MEVFELANMASVTAITVVAYLVGEAVKVSSFDKKYIPLICGITGGVLGIASLYNMPSFPADDPITAIAIGIVSGLAATGVFEAVKQFTGGNDNV